MYEARASEQEDLGRITSEHGVQRGVRSGAHINARHTRRWRTLTELLDFRLNLERNTPLGPDDAAAWYGGLVESINGIIEGHTGRLLQGLEQDVVKYGGLSRQPQTWRERTTEQLWTLRDQYLTKAAILRDQRELEAKMPKPSTGQTTNILNIHHSSIANLNIGTQIGQIQNIVGGLQEKGFRDIADAIKVLTEEIVAAPGAALSDVQKREAVELVATISDEVAKPASERRAGTLRAVGTALIGLVKHVDKLAAGYELVKVAASALGIELPLG